ncbi:LPS export ABC transporter periplasmic protein LptC [Rhodanobacter sp. C06]|uniref:LPS export ABC transporter periplasmic protein LptC n=1 Tax=Rhodanobacter sp. C06 TaxID=1945854 RepID=UPI0020C23C38|nr:LPS export ABC transporter periplasmic protein LptC [Rhodanobacter sp. C06]
MIARLRRWLRDRKLASAIVVVALGVGLAQLLLWWMGPAPKPNDFVGPPRSGYTLTNFKLWSYNPEGQLAFRMQAPQLERREGDESLYINSPVFDLSSKKPGVPDWHGQSLYGWVDKSGSLIKLQGPVTMHRPAWADTPATDLVSSDVTVWPKENRMVTAAPAQMTQGASRMDGVGMRANLNDNHLELLDNVHATFPPRKRKS